MGLIIDTENFNIIDFVTDDDDNEKSLFDEVLEEFIVEWQKSSGEPVKQIELFHEYSEALLETADKSGKKFLKKWQTMEDDRVRDTHDYLQGVVVDRDERFYTFDGDSARYPGDFGLPENNVNCRCYVELIAQ